jgi:hypothetical protein
MRVLKRQVPIVLGSVSLACGLTILPAHAQDSAAPVAFDIASQPLARALNSWAVQAGAQVFFEQVPAAGHTAPALSGSRAPREALHALLVNSGLDFIQDEGGAFVVRPAAAQRRDRAVRGNTAVTAADRAALGARCRRPSGGASVRVYLETPERRVIPTPRGARLERIPGESPYCCPFQLSEFSGDEAGVTVFWFHR